MQQNINLTPEQQANAEKLYEYVQQAKKQLKQYSKNQLISMVTNNLMEIHSLKLQLEAIGAASAQEGNTNEQV